MVDFNFAFNIRNNVQIEFSSYFEMFTSAFGPDKHTSEVRFRVKTMRKKLIVSRFTYSVKITGKVGEKNPPRAGSCRIENLTLGVGISTRDSARG